MSPSPIDYPSLLQKALRGLLREILDQVGEIGPTGEAHLLITFDTAHPEVEMPSALRSRFPDGMTIELQHQFWDLETDDEGFNVVLSFGGQKAYLRIPWPAINGFIDPEASFGLSLEAPPSVEEVEEEESPEASDTTSEGGNVVSIDRFRK